MSGWSRYTQWGPRVRVLMKRSLLGALSPGGASLAAFSSSVHGIRQGAAVPVVPVWYAVGSLVLVIRWCGAERPCAALDGCHRMLEEEAARVL